MTPERRGLHQLALNLGCLVSDIEDRMSFREYRDWVQFYSEQHKGDSPADDVVDLAAMTPDEAKAAIGLG